MDFLLETTSFNDKEIIPKKYTCEGENISPPLEWKNAPNGTQSFVLLMDDPDAPLGTWNHWIIYNIPNHITKLEENIKTLPNSAKLGLNSWGEEKYSGPCPPEGEHRYYFRLLALNNLIKAKNKISRANIEKIIKPYIIGEAELMGRYKCKEVN